MFEEKNVVNIFGIKGEKGAGKDTFAGMVLEKNPRFKVFRFADDLKEMCAEIFGFPLEHSHDPVLKEMELPNPVQMDQLIDEMSIVTGLEIKPQGKVAYKLRDILQYFGTEYVRSVQDDYWIQRVVEKVKGQRSHVLITDCRFPNEAEALRLLGAEIIEIVRLDSKTAGKDKHASEQEMSKIKPDIVLGTLTGKFWLQKAAANLISGGNAHKLCKYDHSNVSVMLKAYNNGDPISECNNILGLNEHQREDIIGLVQYYGYDLRPQDT